MDYESEDNWFYDSIRRYKTLLMYELRMNPLRMTKVGKAGLCITGHHSAKNMSEMVLISMPEKMLLPKNDASLCKNNDFEIESSQFLNSEVHMIKTLEVNERVIVAFKESSGLTILDFNTENSGCSEGFLLQNKNLIAPNFDTHETKSEVIVTKHGTDEIYQVDCQTSQETSFKLPEDLTTTDGEILCSYCDRHNAAFLQSRTGSIATYDFRSNDFATVRQGKISDYVFSCDRESKIALLSSKGRITIYDRRYANSILIETELIIPIVESKHLKVSLATDNRIAVSGFDNFVYIYDTSGNTLQQIFKHAGHNEAEDTENVIVSDHFWLPEVSANLVVSCAKNGTLNCWEYVE